MKIDGKDSKVFLEEITFKEHNDFSEVQLMRTGTFMHPFFEEFEITEEMFKSFRKNFRNKVKKVDLAIDYSHMSGDRAAGWITEVILKEKNTELWVAVNWTPEAVEKIRDREFRYMSADFTTNFVDNETSKKFGATLNGGALTNRPFIKDMDAVLSDIDMSDEKRQAIMDIYNSKEHSMRLGEALGNRLRELREAKEWSLGDAERAMNEALDAEDGAGDGGISASTIGQIERGDIETPSAPVMSAFAQIYDVSLQSLLDLLSGEPGSGRFSQPKGNKEMNVKEVKKYIATLSEEEKIAQGFVEIKEVEVQLSDDESKAKVEKLKEENKKLSEDAEKSAKEAEFSKLLADDKAVEAQREAFMKGDMTKFAEQAVKLNTEVKGNGDDGSDHDKDKKKDEPKTFDEAAEKANGLVDVMLKENKGMKFDEAHKKVLSDNPELEKIMEAA